jgi:hypothetical protein
MGTPNPHEHSSADQPAPGGEEYEPSGTSQTGTSQTGMSQTGMSQTGMSPTWTSGSGLSVALSLAFYVMVLAIGISYDHRHALRDTGTGTAGASSPDAGINETYVALHPKPPFQTFGSASVALARAHDCARAGQWDCVEEATQMAVALRSSPPQTTPENTPETQTQLAQANLNDQVTSSRLATTALTYRTHQGAFKTADRTAGTRRVKWHVHRRSEWWARSPYSRRLAYSDSESDIYRH